MELAFCYLNDMRYPLLSLRKRIGWAVLFLTGAGPLTPGLAQGPHEILLLANSRSELSMSVAKEYARLRRVPAANLIVLDIPLKDGRAPNAMTPEAFTEQIWNPARQSAERGGIAEHILAWVYAPDFPLRIASDPPVSLTGATFVRNRIPDSDTVKRGLYANPLFAGPMRGSGRQRLSRSLDMARLLAGDAMPLPAMMLGIAGPQANTEQEILAALRRGAASDGTRPSGTVLFVTGEDIRARERAWQFEGAVRELRERNIRAEILDTFPRNRDGILGLMAGAARLDTAGAGQFLPGAMADHLTSFAAAFDADNQTRLTAWIRAGATLSSGTVTEPYALWQKFPHARFFVHYAAGCTALESFSQSVRDPLQLLLAGDPLARPWAADARLRLEAVRRGPEPHTLRVELALRAAVHLHFPTVQFLLDGHPLRDMDEIKADPDPARKADEQRRVFLVRTGPLERRRYTLRAIAIGAGSVRQQIFDEQTVAL